MCHFVTYKSILMWFLDNEIVLLDGLRWVDSYNLGMNHKIKTFHVFF